jgi:uncharacterized membrane protein YphA (DoxX/SURF4 family)
LRPHPQHQDGGEQFRGGIIMGLGLALMEEAMFDELKIGDKHDATIALQLSAGIAIALGWRARLGAAALGLFSLATAILFHNNFANRIELLHFDKDLAIAGGMFVLMVRGAGAWSVDGLSYARKLAAVTA